MAFNLAPRCNLEDMIDNFWRITNDKMDIKYFLKWNKHTIDVNFINVQKWGQACCYWRVNRSLVITTNIYIRKSFAYYSLCKREKKKKHHIKQVANFHDFKWHWNYPNCKRVIEGEIIIWTPSEISVVFFCNLF